MVKIHDFNESRKVGEAYEAVIDNLIRPHFASIAPVKYESECQQALQRMGIDRFLLSKMGFWYTAEYKAEIAGGYTGNFFLEYEIQTMDYCKPGWVRKVQANLVLCVVPDAGVLYFFNGLLLKRLCEMWLADKAYPEGVAQNKGYRGVGLCVPFADLCGACAWYFDGVRNKLKFNQEEL